MDEAYRKYELLTGRPIDSDEEQWRQRIIRSFSDSTWYPQWAQQYAEKQMAGMVIQPNTPPMP